MILFNITSAVNRCFQILGEAVKFPRFFYILTITVSPFTSNFTLLLFSITCNTDLKLLYLGKFPLNSIVLAASFWKNIVTLYQRASFNIICSKFDFQTRIVLFSKLQPVAHPLFYYKIPLIYVTDSCSPGTSIRPFSCFPTETATLPCTKVV